MIGLALILTGIIIFFTIFYLNKKSSQQIINLIYFQRKEKIVAQQQQQQQNIIKKQSETDLYILFGSQTGCAERLSTILTDEGNEQGFKIKLLDLEEYDQIPEIENKICIFLIATHGEGEPTDNSRQFLKWFKKQEQNESLFLKNFKFAVFGLGNIEYEYYNAMGKKFNKILEKAGGQRIYKYGEGDDSIIGRLEDNFNTWKEGIWDHLKATLFPEKIFSSNKVQQLLLYLYHFQKYQAKCNIIKSEKKLINYNQFPVQKLQFQAKKQLQSSYFKILSIKQLRQNLNDGSTLHFVLEPIDTNFTYRVSQNLDIYPMNTITKCQEIAQLLNIDLQEIVEIVPKNKNEKFPFPSPIVIQDILQRFCDFQGIVMKKTLVKLSKIAQNKQIKEKLMHLASEQGTSDYEKEILSQMKTIVDLIKIYDINATLSQFVELCSRMTPRTYTISSSPLNSGKKFNLTIHLQEDILQNNELKKGVAAQYFEQMEKSNNMQLLLATYRDSPFILPINKATPIIMISIGCGIAPFRGFLQENLALFEKNELIYENMILYYGCRHQNGDFIYKDEFLDFEQKGILKKMHLAFSRDQNQKVYVQDLISQTSNELNDYIDNGIFYMCGKASMGKEIINEIVKIFINKRSMTEEQALKQLKQMEDNKQFIKELWG